MRGVLSAVFVILVNIEIPNEQKFISILSAVIGSVDILWKWYWNCAAALQSVFAQDLTENTVEIKASHVRGEKKPITQYLGNQSQKTSLSANEQAYGAANLLDTSYHSYWTVDDSVTSAWVSMSFAEPVTFNRVMLQEYIPLGQRVSKFHIDILTPDDVWKTIATETTIGYKRIALVPMCTAKALRVHIDESLACPVLNRVALFRDDLLKE